MELLLPAPYLGVDHVLQATLWNAFLAQFVLHFLNTSLQILAYVLHHTLLRSLVGSCWTLHNDTGWRWIIVQLNGLGHTSALRQKVVNDYRVF
jgi:hypothetical protein